MTLHKAFLRCIVAAAVILTPAAASAAGDTRTFTTIVYTIVNNTTTPTPAGRDPTKVPAGVLPASCDGLHWYGHLKDTTQDKECQMDTTPKTDSDGNPVEPTHTLTYSVHTGAGPNTLQSGTVDWACKAGQKMKLTFTGSGAGVTYSSTCVGTATDDDQTGDGGAGRD